MILWIANPLCDDTACWHAALRVLRAEAAQYRRTGSCNRNPLLIFFSLMFLMSPGTPNPSMFGCWVFDLGGFMCRHETNMLSPCHRNKMPIMSPCPWWMRATRSEKMWQSIRLHYRLGVQRRTISCTLSKWRKSYIHHHLPKKDFPQNAVCFCNLLLKPTSLGAVCIRVIAVSCRKLRFSAVIKWPKFGGHQTMQLYGKFEGFLLFFVRTIWARVGVILKDLVNVSSCIIIPIGTWISWRVYNVNQTWMEKHVIM